MIRKLMASSAIIALTTAGAFSVAQGQTDTTQTQQPAAIENQAAPAGQGATATGEQTTPIAEGGPTLTPDQPTIATAFIGRAVYSSEGDDSDNIGEVNDLIIGNDGKITHAVVGVGGFLGIGEKDVSVPFDQLQVVQEEDGDVRLIYAATREQLEAAEAFDRTAFDPEERVEEQQQAAADAQAGVDAGGVATAPAALPAGATADTAAATDAATSADQQTTAQADAAATVDQQQTAASSTATVTTDPNAPATTETAANAVPSEAGFVNFSGDQIRASDIIGEELYGAENESIGEVSDLVLQPDGKTRVAVIDVGGFLGIGEKRVAIPFDQIEFMQDADAVKTDMTAQDPAAQTDPNAADPNAPAGTDTAMAPADPNAPASTAPANANAAAAPAVEPQPRLVVAMTRQQLEQLPEWQDTTEQAAIEQTAQDATAGQDIAAAPADPNAPVDPNAPAATGTAAAPADPNAPADQNMAAADASAGQQYQTATQDLSADDLMGSAVYSQADENLGEVGDVIFTKAGQIEAVVVDVGGFLGIGEKPVAVQFDALNVQKSTGGDIRLMVNATQEQLQAAPSYDETAAAGGQPAPVQ